MPQIGAVCSQMRPGSDSRIMQRPNKAMLECNTGCVVCGSPAMIIEFKNGMDIVRRFITAFMTLVILISIIPVFDTAAYAAATYRIEVDITNQIVTIYKISDGSIVRQMLCSTGMDDATPLGTYTMPAKTNPDEREEWYYFPAYGVYAKYATRVFKGIMFHSIPYNSKRESSISKKDVEDFGTPASHGCIRLRWQDAQFIAENCLKGTKVKFYKSGVSDEDLRELLMQASYTGENGQTYRQFLGIPDEEGVLGRFSEGADVRNLQYRLRDLGVFSEEIDGEYKASTVNAVKQVQEMLGLDQTGYATAELQEMIYSDDAPVAMNVPLKEGMSGPAVRSLQQDLAVLRLYEGSCDGVYDLDVIEAVKRFQRTYGYSDSGIAYAMVQKAIHYEAGKVTVLFSMSGGYTMEEFTESVYMGRISSEAGIRLRKSASTESDVLARLTDGDLVFALKYGDTWSKVQFGDSVGYIKNVFADYFKQDISALTYKSSEGDRFYTIGYTAQQYLEGASIPSRVFEEYLASGGSLDNYEGIASFATVATEAGISLNLRRNPSTSGVILLSLPEGTQVKVLIRSSDWSYVEYDGLEGYLMNDYLEFWQGPEDALEPETDISYEGGEDVGIDALYAVVEPDDGGKAAVYDVDSEDARVLGHLNEDAEVKVVASVNGWSLINYLGHEGYMKDEDLHFVVGSGAADDISMSEE